MKFSMRFPIKYFEENIIVTDNNDYWALYKLQKFDYDFLNIDKKFEIFNNLTRFIANIGHEAKVLIIPIIVDYKRYFENLNKFAKEYGIFDIAKDHISMSNDFVKNYYKNNVNDYDVFIITKLTKNFGIDNWKETLGQAIIDPFNTINAWLGIGKQVSRRYIEKYIRVSKDFRNQQSRRLKIEPADENDIKWLIKKSFFRGIDEEVNIWDNWKPFRALEVDRNEMVLNLSSGEVDLTGKRMIKINHENETSYQSFVVMTKVPDEILFPGFEFLLFSQQLNFPVETLISINNVSTTEALKKLDSKKRAINSQFEHIERNREDVPEEVWEAKENLEELRSELKGSSSPLAKTSFYFCVYADTKKELEYRVKTLMNFYKDFEIGVERPVADQYKLFMEFIPGTGRYDKNYVLPVTPKLIASGMFGTTADLGDHVGPYIGRGGNLEKPVFLDLLHACQLNKPAAALVVGAQGYGKTFNTNLLVYNHVIHLGARAFIIDPKGDRRDWDIKIPKLSDYVNVVEFKANEEDKGKLDPFIIYRDNMGEAGELAAIIITELFNIKTESKTYVALQDAIEKTKQTEKPCMSVLVDALRSCPKSDNCWEDAILLSRKLANLGKGGLANLLFSQGNIKALDFNKNINIVMIQNLKLPSSASKSDYSSDEKLGTVLMLAVANFAKKFSQIDNSIKKIVVMDEAWALARTKQGEDLFERLARTGRSLNTSCIFIGHSSKDLLSEGIRNSIRYKFVFNVVNREEAIRTLEFLNMDITEENIALLSSDERGLGNGECIFSDVEGRIGILKFDAVDPNLIEAFKTTPPEHKKEVVL
jgi:hypothetical protein